MCNDAAINEITNASRLALSFAFETDPEGGRVRKKTEAVQAVPLPESAESLRRPQGSRDRGDSDQRDPGRLRQLIFCFPLVVSTTAWGHP